MSGRVWVTLVYRVRGDSRDRRFVARVVYSTSKINYYPRYLRSDRQETIDASRRQDLSFDGDGAGHGDEAAADAKS
jgi:hypothetical protein